MLLRNLLQTQYGLPRRTITSLIDQDQLFVNEKKVENYKAEVHIWDKISIPSLHLQFQVKEEKSDSPSLLAFNKPKGYTCSKSDPHNPTFYELLPPEFRQEYYYIGRLDKESRGLMLLTSDPHMVHAFEHPSKEILKTYLVKLDRPFDWQLKTRILKGIEEGGELLRTKKLEKSDFWRLKITLNEGKKRHIRRIFKALGYEVLDLQRISIGEYKLDTLPEWKYLSLSVKNNKP